LASTKTDQSNSSIFKTLNAKTNSICTPTSHENHNQLHLSPNVFDPLGSQPVNNSTNHQTQFSITESINQAINQFINQEMNKLLSLSHPSSPLSKTSILLPSKSKQQSLASTIHPSVDVVSAISNNFNPHQKAENFLSRKLSTDAFKTNFTQKLLNLKQVIIKIKAQSLATQHYYISSTFKTTHYKTVNSARSETSRTTFL
jgi:hypothetical protein